jgi:transposase
MPQEVLPDKLWKDLKPFIPPDPPRNRRGRPVIPARKALKGILFVLKSGIPWEMLPKELGCGSGMTCWRRLRDWQKAGVWKEIHGVLLAELRREGKINLKRAVMDGSNVRALFGGPKRARIPRIKLEKAQNAIFLQMQKGILSLLNSPEPTATTPRNR